MPNRRGGGKTTFALKAQDGQYVIAEVSNKTWNKLVKTAEEWPQWVAALSGTMGARTERGFRLENPGLQVYERKPKVPAEATSVAEAAPPPSAMPARASEAVPASPTAEAATSSSSPASRKTVLSLKKGQKAS